MQSNDVGHVEPGYLTPASGYLDLVLGRPVLDAHSMLV